MNLLNGALEGGIHGVCLLVKTWPAAIDIDRLTMLDHLVFFGGRGVDPIQPPISQSTTGLVMRRQNLTDGLRIFIQAGLVEYVDEGQGGYRATEEANSYVAMLEGPAAKRLIASCESAAVALGGFSDEDLARHYSEMMREDITSMLDEAIP